DAQDDGLQDRAGLSLRPAEDRGGNADAARRCGTWRPGRRLAAEPSRRIEGEAETDAAEGIGFYEGGTREVGAQALHDRRNLRRAAGQDQGVDTIGGEAGDGDDFAQLVFDAVDRAGNGGGQLVARDRNVKVDFFAVADDGNELVDPFGVARFALGVAELAQDRRVVELVDAMPGGEIDVRCGRQRALAVGGRGLVAERRHDRLEREQAVEIGAADMHAGRR